MEHYGLHVGVIFCTSPLKSDAKIDIEVGRAKSRPGDRKSHQNESGMAPKWRPESSKNASRDEVGKKEGMRPDSGGQGEAKRQEKCRPGGRREAGLKKDRDRY